MEPHTLRSYITYLFQRKSGPRTVWPANARGLHLGRAFGGALSDTVSEVSELPSAFGRGRQGAWAIVPVWVLQRLMARLLLVTTVLKLVGTLLVVLVRVLVLVPVSRVVTGLLLVVGRLLLKQSIVGLRMQEPLGHAATAVRGPQAPLHWGAAVFVFAAGCGHRSAVAEGAVFLQNPCLGVLPRVPGRYARRISTQSHSPAHPIRRDSNSLSKLALSRPASLSHQLISSNGHCTWQQSFISQAWIIDRSLRS